MYVSYECCVFSGGGLCEEFQRSLRRFPPILVFLSVISKPQQQIGLPGLSSHENNCKEVTRYDFKFFPEVV